MVRKSIKEVNLGVHTSHPICVLISFCFGINLACFYPLFVFHRKKWVIERYIRVGRIYTASYRVVDQLSVEFATAYGFSKIPVFRADVRGSSAVIPSGYQAIAWQIIQWQWRKHAHASWLIICCGGPYHNKSAPSHQQQCRISHRADVAYATGLLGPRPYWGPASSEAPRLVGPRALVQTSAVLRLECSIDCISGSVGHQHNIFRSFSHCQRFFWISNKFNLQN